MKKTILLIATLFGFFAAQAEEAIVEGIKYYLGGETAYVIAFDESDNYSHNEEHYFGDIVIPTSITVDNVNYNVDGISDHTFFNCPNLTSISLPETLTYIGYNAFQNCTSLASVIIPNSVTVIGSEAFRNCIALTNAIISNSIISLEYNTFNGCSSLTSVTIPSSVKNIGQGVFYNCCSLSSITIPSSVLSISFEAFRGCNNLKDLTIENSDTYLNIDKNGFTNLPLENIHIGRNLMYDEPYEWEAGLFANLHKLKEVTISDNVTFIGKRFLTNCPNYLEINIPTSVVEIRDDAFEGDFTTLTFNSTTPANIGISFEGTNLLIVPDAAFESYYNAWSNYYTQILSVSCQKEYDVTVEAQDKDSEVLRKVLNGGPDSKVYSVIDLKVKGDINSYDIMVMRNKMLNLRNLDLSEANIVANSYEYYTGYSTTNDEIGPFSFYQLNYLKSVKLPNSVKTIKGAAFGQCAHLEEVVFGVENSTIEDAIFTSIGSVGALASCNLKSITFNDKLASIGTYAFSQNEELETLVLSESLESICNGAFYWCSSLKNITFPPVLKNIGNGVFQNCSSLEKINLPTSLQEIGQYAFRGCSNLLNVRIPASIQEIGDFAFETPSVRDIYTWTIEPTNINQNTFHSDLYTKARLHTPKTSSYLYYWDTQWSQFQTREDFNEQYEYFYLKNKDLEEDKDTPRIEGDPDADILAGSGLVVEGDAEQSLGEVTVEVDEEGNSGSIIGGSSNTATSGSNINVENLIYKIEITANRWYFFCFPFDINLADIHFDGQGVWRYYDGDYRALYGNGAWKTFEGTKLERGKGYIFQGSKSCSLTLRVGKAAFGGGDISVELKSHSAVNLQDASWNLVGNPFTSYHAISDINYSSPITIWNGSTYEAYTPGDDDLYLHPFQAFFVQKPDANTDMGFSAEYQVTKNQSENPTTQQASRARRMSKARSLVNRDIINLEVSDGTATDKTRVVFNEQSLDSYELSCDASKFMSTSAPQIYTMDGENVQYSINERPLADGVVRVGFKANHSGSFTLSASRVDRQMWLKDTETGAICDLRNEEYQFTADAGTFEDRFILVSDYTEVTGIEEIAGETETDTDASYYGVNGMRLPALNHSGVTIVRKGDKVEKVLSK